LRAIAKRSSKLGDITEGESYLIANLHSNSNTTICIINGDGVMVRVKKKDFKIVGDD
jgi:c-di-GMP-binding flagellar brake protein YcgR